MGMLMIGWVLAGTDGENARFWGAACVTSGLIFFVWVGFFIYKRFVIIVRRLGRTITNIVWHLAGSVLIWGACLGVGLGMWAGRSERIANTINEGILLAGLGLAWASIGMYMYDHFREVEKGKHSVETYHYAWQRIIDVCRPRPECPKAAEGALQTEDGG